MDKTPEQTLKKKFDNLLNVMTSNSQVKLLYTNNIVISADGDLNYTVKGKQVKAKYGLVGTGLVQAGNIVLFEIL